MLHVVVPPQSLSTAVAVKLWQRKPEFLAIKLRFLESVVVALITHVCPFAAELVNKLPAVVSSVI